MKRRLILPTVLGVVALGVFAVACDDGTVPPDPAPDGVLPISSADGPLADAPGLDAGADAPELDAGADASELDAFVPLDSPPDTPA